jgi:hypothetical protein
MAGPQKKFPPYGIGPAVWGPCFWTTMHIVSLGVSTAPSAEEQEGIRKFYESLQVVIPCPLCRSHYKEALIAMPLRTRSRDELVEWVYDIHNYINQQLGKSQMPWEGYIAKMQSLASTATASSGESRMPFLFLGIGVGLAVGIAGSAGYLRFMKR